MMILHLCKHDKFIPGLIDFMRRHFAHQDHAFITYGDKAAYPYAEGADTIHFDDLRPARKQLRKAMERADKIILHCFYNPPLSRLLFLNPELARKCYWSIWGYDLYKFRETPGTLHGHINEFCRRSAMKNFRGIISCVEGDAKLARHAYGMTAPFHECISYTSNLYNGGFADKTSNECLSIQIGNSADPSNNHMEVMDRLRPYKDENILIYCPLSYGDAVYAKDVEERGRELFGTRFVAIKNFMSPKNYRKLQSSIDIAIFAHHRQQGMGNIITLLGMGKKVYMRSNVTTWDCLKKCGAELYDLEELDLTRIAPDVAAKNNLAIAGYFSEENMASQYAVIFRS
ncbi:MAG: hypothetical protein DI626_07335 [Micavibrio aeruginosavorus]|uniref:4-alpha-L-fucosyltransferase n=1 Tax=Micavibrio aeruginosavorus TaxID=349221 RepID=A0A2W4ZX85_9BACT|nr:MAG: hypothetical protein DI626_07335 [Micavibrio aeruginosavorus]